MQVIIENKVKAMICGKIKYTSKNLGFNLLISRLSKKYALNPVPSELQSCLDEANLFFTKYEGIMKNEYDAMQNA